MNETKTNTPAYCKRNDAQSCIDCFHGFRNLMDCRKNLIVRDAAIEDATRKEYRIVVRTRSGGKYYYRQADGTEYHVASKAVAENKAQLLTEQARGKMMGSYGAPADPIRFTVLEVTTD